MCHVIWQKTCLQSRSKSLMSRTRMKRIQVVYIQKHLHGGTIHIWPICSYETHLPIWDIFTHMRHVFVEKKNVSHMSACITCEWFTHMSKCIICKWFMSHTNASREIGTSHVTHSDQMSHVFDVSHFGHIYIRHMKNTVTFWSHSRSHLGHIHCNILVTFAVTFGHIYGHILVREWFMSHTNTSREIRTSHITHSDQI